MFMWWVSTLIVVVPFGSYTTMSASEPGAIAPLRGIEAEHARRGRGAQLDPAGERELAVDDALVDQVHPVLDTADAVRDLGEVAEAELLLLLEAERAVVGAHDRQVVRCAGTATARPGDPRARTAAAWSTRTWRLRSPGGRCSSSDR